MIECGSSNCPPWVERDDKKGKRVINSVDKIWTYHFATFKLRVVVNTNTNVTSFRLQSVVLSE